MRLRRWGRGRGDTVHLRLRLRDDGLHTALARHNGRLGNDDGHIPAARDGYIERARLDGARRP